MKLSFNPLTLRESTEAPLKIKDAIGMISHYKQSVLNKIADYVQKLGFPESFKVELEIKDQEHKPIELELELSNKEINDKNSFHTLTFNYEMTSRSYRELMHDFGDEDNEKQVEIYDACSSLMDIYIVVEFTSKFDKVYGTVAH